MKSNLLVAFVIVSFLQNSYAQVAIQNPDSVISYVFNGMDTLSKRQYSKNYNKYNYQNKLTESNFFLYSQADRKFQNINKKTFEYYPNETLEKEYSFSGQFEQLKQTTRYIYSKNKLHEVKQYKNNANLKELVDNMEYHYKNDTLIEIIYSKNETNYYKASVNKIKYQIDKIIFQKSIFNPSGNQIGQIDNTYYFEKNNLTLATIFNKENKIDSIQKLTYNASFKPICDTILLKTKNKIEYKQYSTYIYLNSGKLLAKFTFSLNPDGTLNKYALNSLQYFYLNSKYSTIETNPIKMAIKEVQ